jgi:hypothetical protein
MRVRLFVAFFVVAVALAAFTAGTLANIASSAPHANNEALALKGHASIRGYHADGTLFASREIDNALREFGRNLVASCGGGATPTGQSCSGWVTRIAAWGLSTGPLVKSAPSTLLPEGCNPDYALSGQTNTTPCTSWKVSATFDSEITSAGSINAVEGFGPLALGFDLISVSPAVPIAPGDRLIITITFTIP